MPIYSLDHVFGEQTNQLSKQVIIAQFFGALLLIIPSFFLPVKFWLIGLIFGFIVLTYTIGFAGFWYRDQIFKALFKQDIPSRLRLDQVRNSLGLLVFIDSTIILILIGSTGGVAHSHLTGILLLIPCVMSIVAIKPRHFVYIASMLGVIFLIIFVTGFFSNERTPLKPLVFFCRKLQIFCGESSKKDGYLFAVSTVAFLSILLIFLEKFVIKLKLFTDKWSFSEIVSLQHLHKYDSFLADDVNRGFRRYRRYLEETNIPDPHISLVHNPQAAFSQAYILAYPSYQVGKRNDAGDVAFVTFASHWIDDIFDGYYTREILDAVPEEEMEKLTLPSVCNLLRGIGIKRMAQHILHCAKDKELVESGLFRVMLAGLLQHAKKDIMDELEKLYRDTYRNKEKLDKELGEKVDSLEINLLLATARTSFGLILGCESPRNSQERNKLDNYACLFDLILCPLVLFHDLSSEIRWEQGTLPKPSRNFLDNLIDISKLAVRKLPDYMDQDTVPGHVRAEQLRIVMNLYLDLVPKDGKNIFKKEYKEYLGKFITKLEEGRHLAK